MNLTMLQSASQEHIKYVDNQRKLFEILNHAIGSLDKKFGEVSVMRLVKSRNESISASSRGMDKVEYDNQFYHYILFRDRDDTSTLRAVVYSDTIAKSDGVLVGDITSVALTARDNPSKYGAFLRSNMIKVRKESEHGGWKFAEYTDRAVKCLRVIVLVPTKTPVPETPASMLTTRPLTEGASTDKTYKFTE